MADIRYCRHGNDLTSKCPRCFIDNNAKIGTDLAICAHDGDSSCYLCAEEAPKACRHGRTAACLECGTEKAMDQRELIRLVEAVQQVRRSGTFSTEVYGVKISPCDDYGMTHSERAMEGTIDGLKLSMEALLMENARLKRENAFYAGMKRGKGHSRAR